MLIAIVLSFVSVPLGVMAQYIIKEADVQFELYNYSEAIKLYEQAWKKKPTVRTARRLAFCNQIQQNYQQRESWAALAAVRVDREPEDVLNYAKALQENGKYSEAKIQYQQYKQLRPDTSPVLTSRWIQSCDSALKWMKEPRSIQIVNQTVLNSPQSEWAAVSKGNSIIFVSNRNQMPALEKAKVPFLKFDGKKMPDENIDGYLGHRYFSLYFKNGADSVKIFPLEAGIGYHVGPASFTGDGRQMFFAMARIPENSKGTKLKILDGKLVTATVGIYQVTKDANGNWGKPEAFKYNDQAYSNTDPYISNDGRYLYFVSNRAGGVGGTDIYVSAKNNAGEWGAPINLREINTEGNERTPAFDLANHFYFSSDGYVGMGGLDNYVANMKNGQLVSLPQNLGYPLNSPQDDFAFTFDSSSAGYFASNRIGGLGEDDIYHFAQKAEGAYRLSGVVYQKGTRLPLAMALGTLRNSNGEKMQVETDASGKYSFSLDAQSNYELTFEKTGFGSEVVSVETKEVPLVITQLVRDLFLEKIQLNKSIRIENIYYTFDHAYITPAAAIELDKLVTLMKENPTIWIEIESHTDSRGNARYNLELSQRRAEAVVQYLANKGIDKSRLTAIGYGETKLVNDCADGVKCSVEAHQLNRRTEFKIVKQ